jgi:cell division protein FtsB
MRKERNKKSFIAGIFSSQVFLTILGLVVLVMISFPLAKNISQRHKIDKEVGQMQEEISRLEKKNSGLRQLAGYLESDQFVESEARLKLGLKKNGEQVVNIKGPSDGSAASVEPQSVFNLPGLDTSDNGGRAENNPERWFKYFFDKK